MSRDIVDLTPAEIDKLARDAWSDAARSALDRGLAVSGSRSHRRFRLDASGRTEDLGPVGGNLAIEQTFATLGTGSPRLHFQNSELPEAYREMAEVKLSQASDVYRKATADFQAVTNWSELANQLRQNNSAYRSKLVDCAKINTFAVLDFMDALFAATSYNQALELWASHARQQFELLSSQAKELAELTKSFAERIEHARSKEHEESDKDSSVG
jgi:hypothetical protein